MTTTVCSGCFIHFKQSWACTNTKQKSIFKSLALFTWGFMPSNQIRMYQMPRLWYPNNAKTPHSYNGFLGCDYSMGHLFMHTVQFSIPLTYFNSCCVFTSRRLKLRKELESRAPLSKRDASLWNVCSQHFYENWGPFTFSQGAQIQHTEQNSITCVTVVQLKWNSRRTRKVLCSWILEPAS